MKSGLFITNINIESYRGLRNIEMKNLSKINIIVGQNNSGKTSILEAIQLISNPYSSTVISRISRQRELNRRYIRPNFDRNDYLFWMFPIHGNELKDIKINYVFENKNESLVFKAREMYYEKDELENFELIENSEDIFEKYLEIDVIRKNSLNIEELTLFKNNERIIRNRDDVEKIKSKFNCAYISSTDHKSSLISASLIQKVFESGQKEKLLDMIAKFDDNIHDIIVENNTSKFKNDTRGSEIFLEHKKKGRLPLFVYGDGMQKVMLIASKIIGASNGILLIDEIETGIHTELIQDYFRWIENMLYLENITLIATTHSLEAVDGIINEANLEGVSLYRLSDNDIKYFSGLKVKSLRNDFGQDVRY